MQCDKVTIVVVALGCRTTRKNSHERRQKRCECHEHWSWQWSYFRL